MKKNILLFAAAFSIWVAASAQAYEGNTQYDKKKQPAVIIDYNFSPEAVENAIVLKLQRMGYKPKEEKGLFNKDKGFLVFKNAYITDISKDRMDYAVNIERKSRKQKDEATLYMIMLKDGGNAMSAMGAEDVEKAKSFLNNMLPEVEAADLEIQVKDQEELVAKSEKKLKNLKDDQISLETKLRNNKTDQETTQKDIEAQKQALGILIGRRKTN